MPDATSTALDDAKPAPTVVVTGAAGWLGQNLVRALVPERRSVSAASCTTADEAALLEVIDPPIESVVGDVRDPAVIDRLFDGRRRRPPCSTPAAVIHPRPASREFFDVNVGGTAARARPGPRASARRGSCTCRRTRRSAPTRPTTDRFDEDSPFNPYMGYGAVQARGRAARAAQPRPRRPRDRHRAAAVVLRARSSPTARPSSSRRCGGAASRSSATAPSAARWSTRATSCTGCCAPRSRRGRPGRAYWIADAEPYELRDVFATVREAFEAEGFAVTGRQPRMPAVAGGVAARSSTAGCRRRAATCRPCTCSASCKDTIACDISRARDELGYDPQVGAARGHARERALVPRARRPALMARTVLVTGGSGYFGTVLAEQARGRATQVRIFDLNPPDADGSPTASSSCRATSATATRCAPRARASTSCSTTSPRCRSPRTASCSSRSTWSAPPTCCSPPATPASPRSCTRRRARSSASPSTTRSTEDTPRRPLEAYGRAKLQAELLCHDAVAAGLDVTIVRPRTILGHGRLGIMAMLFEFVADGAPVFVLGGGDNRYQFVHANDLADGVPAAGDRAGPPSYNIGGHRVRHHARDAAGARRPRRHRARGCGRCPIGPGPVGRCRRPRSLGLVPLAPYHWLLYGESLWFDITKARAPSWAGSRALQRRR